MEKVPIRKNFHLHIPVDPNKPKKPSKKCPKCKSRNIKIIGRRRYFLKLALCSIIVLPYWLLIFNLKEEDIPEPPAGAMLVGFLFITVLLAIYGIYCLIKGIIAKGTSYLCFYCKNTFNKPLTET